MRRKPQISATDTLFLITVSVLRALRTAGIATLDGIASALNARGVRTDRGGTWHPNTVRNLLAREASGEAVHSHRTAERLPPVERLAGGAPS